MRTPSRFVGRPFLDYLTKNHYISKGGVEYSKEEVNLLFIEKTTALVEKENEQRLKNKWNNEHEQSSYKAECFLQGGKWN